MTKLEFGKTWPVLRTIKELEERRRLIRELQDAIRNIERLKAMKDKPPPAA